MIPDFTIDEKACTKCGVCIRECGRHENDRQFERVSLENLIAAGAIIVSLYARIKQ